MAREEEGNLAGLNFWLSREIYAAWVVDLYFARAHRDKGDVKLFLWQKPSAAGTPRGTILFVHGSSMASQPTFDLQVPGRPNSSVMEWFAERGFDTWCMDNEGYGRSDKSRPINCDIPNGADDLEAGTQYVLEHSGAKVTAVVAAAQGSFALKPQVHEREHL